MNIGFPKYDGPRALQSLVDFLRAWIRSGHVSVGDVLPSARVASVSLPFDRNTIQKAYGALQNEGFLESAPGQGTRVVAIRPESRRFAWTRHWWPKESSERPSLWQDLLLNPERFINQEARTLDQLGAHPVVVLLGESGMGKTTEVRVASDSTHVGSHPGKLCLDLGRFADAAELRLAFVTVLEHVDAVPGSAVFLDGLDEFLAAEPRLFETVCDLVKELLEHGARVRGTCRASVWTSQFGDRLSAKCVLQDLPVYELLPLRHEDVRLAASSRGFSAEAFMKLVDELGIHHFAARPFTLKFLLDAYEAGELTESRLGDILGRGLEHMVMDSDAARAERGQQGELGVLDRLAIAERLAALYILCGVDGFHDGRSSRGSSQVIGPMEVNALPLLSESKLRVSSDDLKELLSTPLFEPVAARAFRFAHRAYAEFLAARYLANAHFKDDQLERLLWGLRGTVRRLPVALRETVAWLATFRPTILKLVAESEPHVLLLADTAKLSDKQRADLVAGMLQRVDKGEMSWDTQGLVRSLATRLKHSSLAAQLRAVIKDNNWSLDARDLAMDIASECGTIDLADLLIAQCIDLNTPEILRIGAASALRGLQRARANEPLEGLERLRTVLDNAEFVDANQQILGNVLHLLWPRLLSAAELFAALERHPQRNPSLYGAFSSFVSSADVPSVLDTAGILEALAWVKKREVKHPHLGRDDLDKLAEAVLHRAWELIDEPEVLAAAAGPMAERALKHIPIFSHRRDWDEPSEEHACKAELEAHPNRRRLLAAAVVSRIVDITGDKGVQRNHALMLLPGLSGLLIADDLEWAVEQAIASKPRERDIWIEAANRLLGWYPESQWTDQQREYLVRVAKSTGKPSGLLDWIDSMDIHSKEATTARESLRKAREWGRPRKVPRPKHSFRAILDSWLAGSEAGQADCWYRIHQILCIKAALEDLAAREADSGITATKSQIWDSADKKLRERILDATQRYLEAHQPDTSSILTERESWGEYWAAFEALRLLVRERPEWLKKQSDKWWTTWAPLIAMWRDELRDSADLDTFLGRMAMGRARDRCAESIASLLSSRPGWDRSESTLMRFIDYSGNEIVDVIERFVLSEQIAGPRQVESLFAFLINADRERARNLAARCIARRKESAQLDAASVALGAIAIHESADAMWPIVWTAIHSDPAWGKAVFSTLAYGPPREGVSFVRTLSDSQRAELLVWMWTAMPIGDLPDRVGTGAYTPTKDEELARLRESVMGQVVNSDSPDSETALEQLVAHKPENRWFRDCLIRHRERSVRWTRPEPKELAQLLHDASRRALKSHDELASLVVDSIRRYEDRLQRQDNPLYTNLWNLTEGQEASFKGEQHLSDNLNDHLILDLSKTGVIVNREVQITRPKRHAAEPKGRNLDILVEAHGADTLAILRTIIEVKLDTNRDVLTDRVKQLQHRYMEEGHRPSGVYCVGWTGANKKYATPKELLNAVETAGGNSGASGLHAPVIVIDCSIPE